MSKKRLILSLISLDEALELKNFILTRIDTSKFSTIYPASLARWISPICLGANSGT